MKHFSDNLIDSVNNKNNPCIVGLDTRYEDIPEFIFNDLANDDRTTRNSNAMLKFNKILIDLISDKIPIIKVNIAFYERLGIAGLKVFNETINYAKELGLLVIGDVKRMDIASTNSSYAQAYLENHVENVNNNYASVDSITSSIFLGMDSIDPFFDLCKKNNKGVFFLIKTSNKGSSDFQDKQLSNGRKLYEEMAQRLFEISQQDLGEYGYSSLGAVVGATYPDEAKVIRRILKNSILLVPGYGKQGGKASDLINYFNDDGLGAVINSSRNIIHNNYQKNISESDFVKVIEKNVKDMIEDIRNIFNYSK